MGVLDTFTADVEAFLAETGMTPTALGISALKDPNFVPALRAGRSPRAATIDRVYEFMAAHRAVPPAEVAAA
jgi:hypothetical protein